MKQIPSDILFKDVEGNYFYIEKSNLGTQEDAIVYVDYHEEEGYFSIIDYEGEFENKWKPRAIIPVLDIYEAVSIMHRKPLYTYIENEFYCPYCGGYLRREVGYLRCENCGAKYLEEI